MDWRRRLTLSEWRLGQEDSYDERATRTLGQQRRRLDESPWLWPGQRTPNAEWSGCKRDRERE